MIKNGDEAWYLVYSKPKQEDRAWWNLDSQGYRCYLPYVRVQRLYRRRHQTFTEPMFPRYLFIRLAAGVEDWSPIRSTQGVSGLVRFGVWPAQVPDNLINEIRERTEQGYLDLCPRPMQRGDRVRVLDGPFAAYEGIFYAERGDDRAIIMLEAANQHTRLTVSQHSLERV